MSKLINAIEGENKQGKQLATLLRAVSSRARTEAAFRTLALDDTEAAFNAVDSNLGGWKLKFIEVEDVIDAVFVLPPAIEIAPEFTEEELSAVVGSAGHTCGCCVITDLPCILTDLPPR